jgi:signal transduction histidine kinase/BarA-like signal transduction histidine kinase
MPSILKKTGPLPVVANQSNRRKRYAYFVPGAMVVCFVHAIFCFYKGLYPPAVAMTAEFCFLWVCMYLYEKRYFNLAGFLTVFTLDVLVVAITYWEGLNTGGYLNFFPVLAAAGFMANVKKVSAITSITVGLSLLSMLVSFFISSGQPVGISFSHDTERQLLLMNLLLNFTTVTWFAVVVLMIQRRSNSKLIAAREAAEQAALARTRFLSVMTHELRTPLNGIIGITNIINNEERLPQQQEYLKLLLQSGNHMLRMIEAILQFNKLEADKMELMPTQFHLGRLLADTCALFKIPCSEKGIALYLRANALAENNVLGDDTKIIQVLNNLLSNALKFTNKGSIILSADCQQQKSHELQVLFAVTDTGIGISPAEQLRIFEDFAQASSDTTRLYGGTGLGLTISKKMVELMGGQLQVESEPEKGTRFSFTLSLPLHDKVAASLPQVNMVAAKPNNGFRILVAEDNTVNAKVLTQFLAKWHFDFDVVSNGREVIEHMQQKQYDMILMDLDMPIMDGLTATATLRSHNYSLPIVAFTAALIDRNEVLQLQDRGFDDCLEKPFKPQLLYEKLKRFTPEEVWG